MLWLKQIHGLSKKCSGDSLKYAAGVGAPQILFTFNEPVDIGSWQSCLSNAAYRVVWRSDQEYSFLAMKDDKAESSTIGVQQIDNRSFERIRDHHLGSTRRWRWGSGEKPACAIDLIQEQTSGLKALCGSWLEPADKLYIFGINSSARDAILLAKRYALELFHIDPMLTEEQFQNTLTSVAQDWEGADTAPYHFASKGLALEDGNSNYYSDSTTNRTSCNKNRNGQSRFLVSKPVFSIRGALENFDHKTIDVLLLDVAGTELNVLLYSLEWLSEAAPSQILISFYPEYFADGQNLTSTVFERLDDYQYRSIWSSDDGRTYLFVNMVA